MNITLLSIDIAKNVFQLCGVDKSGKVLKEKRVRRDKLLSTVMQFNPQIIAMEACGSANYWARTFMLNGMEVKLIAPQHVKPFVKGNKNDLRDARGIAEASVRPMMNFVTPKTVEQQDMQSLLRIREGYLDMRKKTSNQIRGLLAEYGITVTKGMYHLRIKLAELTDSQIESNLSTQMKEWLSMQYDFFLTLDKKIKACDKDVSRLARSHESCQRLQKIEGVGEIISLAVVAHIGNGSAFKNGRHFAAYLGLVPSQHSSGDKHRLGGISKRGDNYIRQLMVHGGRSVIRMVDNKQDARSLWAKRIKQERGQNKAAVAVANKNARIMLAMLKTGESYRTAA